MSILVAQIEALLPQTQCGDCGYKGCLPYAEALASGNAAINLCPPGGKETIQALGQLLDIDPKPFEADPSFKPKTPVYARIREQDCIGCTKCIKACPVDAIVGAAGLMHSVLKQECTGCTLCVAPCPVDCIDLVETSELNYDKKQAKKRYQAKIVRDLKERQAQQQRYRARKNASTQNKDKDLELKAKKDYIAQALARVQAKKHEPPKKT